MSMANPRIETPAQLREAIEGLSPVHPFTDAFSARWRQSPKARGAQREVEDVGYDTQHDHWLGWLDGYESEGAYGRKNWSRSAEFVYNHVVNPQMLIYVAEAVNMDRDLLTKAVDGALASQGTMSSMSGAIRRVVPWKMLEAALLGNLPTQITD